VSHIRTLVVVIADFLLLASTGVAKITARFAIPCNIVASRKHAALGRIDILVNNAGSAPGGVLEFLNEEHWAQSLPLKFMGYVRCLKHVLPIMQKRGHGRVVNLIGNDGVKPSSWEIAPGAANAAGQNLTLALAARYGKDNISFVAVNPGPVRTERWAGLVDAMARDMKITREVKIDGGGDLGARRSNAGSTGPLTPSGLNGVGASSKRRTSIVGISAIVGTR
jgi:NAD(P)-dependent dehydrogenase (short-subunit alcohol dehydrogenase family)